MRNVDVRLVSDELHITSVIVQHRAEAGAALADHVARVGPGMELAIPGETRSIVLCEGGSQRAIVERLDTLRAIPGVINVTLVYHHAEPREALDMPMTSPADAPDAGAAA